MPQSLIIHVNKVGELKWVNELLMTLAAHTKAVPSGHCYTFLESLMNTDVTDAFPRFLEDKDIHFFETKLSVPENSIIKWDIIRSAETDDIFLIGLDLTELRMKEKVRELTLTLSKNYLTQSNIGEVFDEVLQTMLTITDSEYGFMGEILTEEDGTPFLKTYALTNIAWDKASAEFYEKHRYSGFEFKNLNTLFGYSIKTGELVIANDAPNDPRKGGIPHGHPALKKYIGIPVKLPNGEMVGLLGLANSPAGYSSSLVDQLRVFLDLFANIIKVKKGEVQRAKVEMDLQLAHQTTESILLALESTQVVILINRDGNITKVNSFLTAVSGYTEEELLGKPFHFFSADSHPDLQWTDIVKKANQGDFWRAEIQNISKNGTLYWVDMIISPLPDQSHQPYQYLGIGSLITNRKETEQKLEAAKLAAESSLRAKRIFIANVSHELRTPLHVILGFGEQLLKNLEVSENRNKLLKIKDSAKGLLDIINDIIDFTQAEEGKLRLRYEAFDLELLTNDVFELLNPLAVEKQIQFSIQKEGFFPRRLMGDAVRLRQILINVLNNSIKFTDKGLVTLHYTIIPLNIDLCRIEFIFTDTGIGISKEMMNRLFTEFSQEEESFQRRYGGSGLGLSITREIVEKMGGTISVESVKGKGSVFKINIPFTIEDTSPDTSPQILETDFQDNSLEQVKILVAEDNSLNKEVIKMMLESMGAVPDIVENGLQAVEMAREFDYDIILMDIQMPEMDGLTAVQNIRLTGRNMHKPVLAITANAITREVQHYLNSGFTGYLIKPFNQQELCHNIKHYLKSDV